MTNSRTSSHRRAVLWTLRGCALSLTVALAACQGAQSSPDSGTAAPHGPVLAKGKDFTVTLAEGNQALIGAPEIPKGEADQFRLSVLNSLIDEKLLEKAALNAKLDQDPKIALAIAATRRRVLASAYAQTLTSDVRPPADTEVEDYYRQHPEAFAHRVIASLDEFVLRGPPAETARLAQKINSNTALDLVSADAKVAGVLIARRTETTASDRLPQAAAVALAAAKPGSRLSYDVGDSKYVARVDAMHLAPLLQAQAEPAIRALLLGQRKEAAVKAGIDRLRADANVTINQPQLNAAKK